MENHSILSEFFKGKINLENMEKDIEDLKKEIAAINTKMKVLPTSREMDAREDLSFLQEHSNLLNQDQNPVFEILSKSKSLEKLIIEDLFINVATSFIKTRIYNNKSLIVLTDSFFTNLIKWISKNIKNCTQMYYKLLNAIINSNGEFYKNNGQEPVNKYPFGELIEIPEEHKNWVDSLKVGDKVDVLRGAQELKIWTRAIIIEHDFNLKIRFLNSDITHYIRNPYFDFAPFTSKSSDYDWRLNLKKDDLVDFFKYNSKWNLHVVVDVCEENIGNATFTEISRKIKIVKQGELKILDYDTIEVHVNSPLIAKPGFFSEKNTNAFEDDHFYLSQANEPKYAIMRKLNSITSSSVFIIRYINEFGKNGGFDFILKIIKNEVQVEKEVFSQVVSFLQSIGEFLVEPFIEKNGLLILETIQNFLLSNAELNLREITPKTLQVLIKGIKSLAQRVHTEEQSEIIANKIKTTLAILCLKSDFLEKQFFGAKILTQISMENHQNLNLHEELIKFNVFDKIIKGHPHLIAKGEGVMKILFEAKVLEEKDLLALWNQILKTDIESRNSLLQLLSQVIPNLTDSEILFLARKMLESSNEINDTEIVNVLFKIQNMGHKRESLFNIIKIINDTLWGVIQSSKKLKDEFVNDVLNNFVNALEKEDNCDYTSQIIQNILDDNKISRNILLIKKLLNVFNFKIKEDLVKKIKESLLITKILDSIYELLKKNQNKQERRDNLFNESETKTINEKFGLIVEIHEKFEDKNLVEFSSIEKIWDEVFENNINDTLLLNWLKIYFIKSKSLSSDTNFVNFFMKNIKRMRESNKEIFFYILVLIFFKIQIFRSNIIKRTIHLETPGVIRNEQNTTEVFILNNYSENFKCFPELWDLFLATDNVKLEEEISKFIIKLFVAKNDKTENFEIYKVEEEKLIAKIFEFLSKNEGLQIKKGLHLLSKMMKIKEESGFRVLNSFSSLLISPKITLEIQQNTYYYKNTFNIKLGLNTSLGNLRSKIAQTYEMEFGSVKILINTNEIPQQDNSKTLGEIEITENENKVKLSENDKWKLVIDEYPLQLIQEYPILDEKNENFTPKALRVFKEIFEHYSTDGKMNKKNLADMTSAATDRMTCRTDDDRVVNFFNCYDPENKGYITVDKFISFYLESTKKNKIKTVRNNLNSFGYNKNLDSKNIFHQTEDNIINSFRYKLAQNNDFWNTLRNILSSQNDNKTLFFDLIQTLTPNFDLVRNISKNPLDQIELYAQSPYLWHYFCGLLDSMLFNRLEIAPFLDFLKIEKTFNLQEFLNALFNKQLSILFVENLKNNSDQDALLFLTSFSLFDKLLKICLQNLDAEFFEKIKKTEIRENLKEEKTEEKDKEPNEKGKKNSFSEEELLQNKNETVVIIDEELLQLKEFFNLLQKENITEFFKNLDLGLINKFSKDFIRNFINSKTNFDLKEICLIKRFLSIWVNTIIGKQEIINDLMNSSKFEEFLISGLTHPNDKLREIFLEHYKILLESSKSFKMKTECLKIFINNIQNNSKNNIQAIIEISSNLLTQISQLKNDEKILEKEKEVLKEFDFLKLFKEFSDMIKNYASKEKTFEDTDTTLIAILSFMTKILQADSEILIALKSEEVLHLINFLFSDCLFEIKGQDINFSKIKCKSYASRNVALELLSQITYKNKDYSLEVLSKGFSPLAAFLPEQSNTLSFSNYNEKKSKLNFLGIKNPGCVCYMIAMLQQFYCTPTFRYGILMADDKKEYQPFEKDGYKIDDNVFHQLQNMFSYLDFSERKAFDPKAFCMSYMDITGQRVDISVQQDSQEFLNVIFDRLDRALQPTPFKGIMDSVFAGKIASVYTCKNCDNVFSNEQLFYNLSLEVKNMESIEDSFRKFNSEEIISDYTCENCKKKVDVSKRAYIKELPNILIIHLQKIIFDLEYLANIKISSKYEFGKEIKLKNYIFKEKTKKEDEDEEEEVVQEDEDEYSYKLVGVVLHRGNAEYGHYTSLINVNRNDPNRKDIDKDIWYNFDDSRISEYNMENFEEDCFGEVEKKKNNYYSSHLINVDLGSSKSAYILVYDKVKKSKIHFHFNEDNLAEKEKIFNCLINKENVKFEDNILETDFYNIGKFVPDSIKNQINNDNSSLVLEEQLFNKSFTSNFSSLILNSGLPSLTDLENHLNNKKQIDLDSSHYELAENLLYALPIYIKKIYCVTSRNDSLPSIDMTLRKSMIILKEKSSIFFEKFLIEELNMNLGYLLGKSDAVIRKSMGNIFLSCFEIFAIEKKINLMKIDNLKNSEEIKYERVLEEFLEKIPSKYSSNYRKAINYFSCLKQMVIKIPTLTSFIIKKHYLKKIIQFYIHQDPKMAAEKRVLVSALNLFTIILKKYNLLPEEEKEPIKEEFDDGFSMLKSMDFFDKIIKEDFLSHENFKPILDIVVYLCKDDENLTNQIINKALKSLTYSMHENIVTILEITKAILLIQDINKLKRIRYLMGQNRLHEEKVKNDKNKLIYSYGLNREISQKRSIRTYLSFVGMEKAFLSHLYKNRKFNETTCILLIYFILQMCNNCEVFFDYFIHLPGSTYNEPNVFCWFDSYIESTTSYLINKNQFNKKEFVNYCFKNVESEFSKFKENLNLLLTQKKNIPLNDKVLWKNMDSKEIFCFGNQNWILGKTNSVKNLHTHDLNDGKLKLEIKLVNLSMMELKSDGEKILNLPWSFLNESLFEKTENPKLKSFIGQKCLEYYDDDNFYYEEQSSSPFKEYDDEEESGVQPIISDEEMKENFKNLSVKEKVDIKNEVINEKHLDEKEYFNNDFILRISLNNFTHDCFYVKLRISSTIENPNFEESEIIIGINRKKKDVLVHNIEKMDINRGFEGLKVEAAFMEIDFLSFKDYDEEVLSDYQEIFVYR